MAGAYMGAMFGFIRSLALCVALVVSVFGAGPVLAQTVTPEPEPQRELPFVDLFERFLRNFMSDVAPQMRELERGFSELEPEIQTLLDRMRGMTQFHPPEILPNGDILIRRREPTQDPDQDAPSDPDDMPSDDPFEL